MRQLHADGWCAARPACFRNAQGPHCLRHHPDGLRKKQRWQHQRTKATPYETLAPQRQRQPQTETSGDGGSGWGWGGGGGGGRPPQGGGGSGGGHEEGDGADEPVGSPFERC